MTRSARRSMLAVLTALVLVAAGGCGDDGADDATTTSGPTATESSTTTAAAPSTTTTTAAPTTLEGALAAWVTGAGSTYLGPCPADFDPAFPLDGLCSVELDTAPARSVQGVGPPFSEVVGYVLLEEGDGGWAVTDEYSPADPFDLADAPSWVPRG